MTITLYAATMSSATPVVHAIEELGVPHELVLLDLKAGDQRKADFLTLNPNGKVPTLVVDGTPMFEALAIMQWLGDRYGVERDLWPAAEAPARLEAMSWSTWMYVTFSGAIQRLIFTTRDRGDGSGPPEGDAELVHAQLQDLLAILDRRLATRGYVVGDHFTLADVIVGNGITYATVAGVSVEGHAHVQAWLAALHERPAFKKAWAMGA